MDRQSRFETLDGYRGLAAIAVATRHSDSIFDFPIAMPTSYLAVDLFFVLSGFVIAHAYDERFRAGVSPSSFIVARIARLYPLYLLGMVLGGGVVICGLILGSTDWDWILLVSAAAFGLMWLPFPHVTPSGNSPYPLNSPSWSLFFELFINLVFALAWRWLTLPRLLVVIVGSGIVLLICVHNVGTVNLGWDWPTFAGGFARVTYSFFVGVLIFRLKGLVAVRIPALALLVALALLLWGPVSSAWLAGYDAIVTIAIFPALTLFGAHVEPPAPIRWLCRWSGRISYPLYAVHVPILAAISGILVVGGLQDWATGVPVFWVAVLCSLIVSAALAERIVDAPARIFWSRIIKGARAASRSKLE